MNLESYATIYRAPIWAHFIIKISVPNRLGNFGDTLLNVKISKDSITWGGEKRDMKTCLTFPEYGFYKRSNEKSVLPHAIGCQRPSATSNYGSVLLGTVDRQKYFNDFQECRKPTKMSDLKF